MAESAVDDALRDRVVLLTGASGGIGRELGRRLAESGADLLLTYATHADDAEQLAEQVRELGRKAEIVQADFVDPAAPGRVVTAATDRLGSLDIVIAAAGVGVEMSWKNVDERCWDYTMAVNVRAPFFLAKQALLRMIARGFGRILLFLLSLHLMAASLVRTTRRARPLCTGSPTTSHPASPTPASRSTQSPLH